MDHLDESAIVVAHPDDENLWLSSILSRVGSIVVCFLPVPSNPTWTVGRRRSLADYPLANLSCLQLPESEVFWGVDWSQPVETEYGLRIDDRRMSDKRYVANFTALIERLRPQLQGQRNVFTHNPWGEYGHPEHVQVYRAVSALQGELGFDLWYSSYVSNKTVGLMGKTLALSALQSLTLPTDKALASRIADLYKCNACWTWYPDYRWPDTESIIHDGQAPASGRRDGTGVGLNFIKIAPPPEIPSPWERRLRRLRRHMRI